MEIIEDLYYSNNHEWIKVENGEAYIGISDFAQENLGDIVFVELPEIGEEFEKEEEIGVVESVKAVSEIYTPISGEILEVNQELLDNPELINEKPYDSWIVNIKIADKTEIDELLTAAEYEKDCEEEEL